MEDIITTINNIVWSNALVVLCFYFRGFILALERDFHKLEILKKW